MIPLTVMLSPKTFGWACFHVKLTNCLLRSAVKIIYSHTSGKHTWHYFRSHLLSIIHTICKLLLKQLQSTRVATNLLNHCRPLSRRSPLAPIRNRGRNKNPSRPTLQCKMLKKELAWQPSMPRRGRRHPARRNTLPASGNCMKNSSCSSQNTRYPGESKPRWQTKDTSGSRMWRQDLMTGRMS